MEAKGRRDVVEEDKGLESWQRRRKGIQD